MKVTPIAGPGAGTPGVATNAQVGSSVSPDRRAAAITAALGQTAITKSDMPIDPQLERAQQSIKKIKMRTNVSPDRFNQEAQSLVDTAPPTLTDPNAQAEPVVEATQPISPQFAALARQKRALQVKESEIAAREKALADGAGPSGTDLVAKLKADPLSVLQEAGVTYEQLTEAILNNQNGINPEMVALKAKIDALEKGFETKLTERDQQAKQQVLSEMQTQVNQLVGQGDDYQMIKAMGKQKDVVGLIERTWEKGWPEKGLPAGYVLDIEEAAKIVEDFYVEDILPIARLGKVQSKLTPAQEIAQTQGPQRQQMRTLTNRDTARPVLDRRARAVAAAMGTLRR
jgi:Skp family chaperone for outer membrane proteins